MTPIMHVSMASLYPQVGKSLKVLTTNHQLAGLGSHATPKGIVWVQFYFLTFNLFIFSFFFFFYFFDILHFFYSKAEIRS
jgi:hypothetical protein